MRTSFHHQPEAQHPNFQLSTSWQADYPIFQGEADGRFHSSPVQITNQAQRLRRSLLLRFELLNERSKMRWNGSCESVVLVLQALPNC